MLASSVPVKSSGETLLLANEGPHNSQNHFNQRFMAAPSTASVSSDSENNNLPSDSNRRSDSSSLLEDNNGAVVYLPDEDYIAPLTTQPPLPPLPSTKSTDNLIESSLSSSPQSQPHGRKSSTHFVINRNSGSKKGSNSSNGSSTSNLSNSLAAVENSYLVTNSGLASNFSSTTRSTVAAQASGANSLLRPATLNSITGAAAIAAKFASVNKEENKSSPAVTQVAGKINSSASVVIAPFNAKPTLPRQTTANINSYSNPNSNTKPSVASVSNKIERMTRSEPQPSVLDSAPSNSDCPLKVMLTEYRQRAKFTKTFVEYKIDVKSHPLAWSVYKRYNEFADLHQTLSNHFHNNKAVLATLPKLPPSKYLGTMKTEFLDLRRRELADYLSLLMLQTELSMSVPVLEFLGVLSTENSKPKEFEHVSQSLHVEAVGELLMEGDIVLMHTEGVLQAMQRSLTNSHYDHVGIVVREPYDNPSPSCLYILEATIEGVRKYPLLRRLNAWNSSDALIAIRQLKSYSRPPNELKKLADFVKAVDGLPYSLTPLKFLQKNKSKENGEGGKGSNSSGSSSSNPSSNQSYFCSELVASAYKVLELLPDDTHAVNYFPVSFAEENNLKLLKGAHLDKEILVAFSRPEVSTAIHTGEIPKPAQYTQSINNNKEKIDGTRLSSSAPSNNNNANNGLLVPPSSNGYNNNKPSISTTSSTVSLSQSSSHTAASGSIHSNKSSIVITHQPSLGDDDDKKPNKNNNNNNTINEEATTVAGSVLMNNSLIVDDPEWNDDEVEFRPRSVRHDQQSYLS